LEKALKRSELKSIVKECLLEILMEGVANGVQQPIKESQVQRQVSNRRPALDYITTNGKKSIEHTSNQSRPVREVNRNAELAKQMAPNDPVMASIFADTASTTLREQVAADSGKQVHAQETGVDPMSLFENSGNWAALAFAEPKVNRGRA
jgi:hypothetical protein